MTRYFFKGKPLFILLIVNFSMCAQDFAWVKPFGNTNCSINANASCTDLQGNIYTQGTFTGTVDFDPGVGTYTLNASSWKNYVTKLDSSGNFVWAKSLPATGNEPADIAADKQGNVYLFSHFGGTQDMDPGPGTYTLYSLSMASYILKLDPNGSFVWARQFTGGFVCWGQSITVDNNKNVYTTGSIYGNNIDFDPDTTTYFLSCNYSNGPGGTGTMPNYTFFTCKLDSMGKFVYAQKSGASYGMVAVNSANDAITTSWINGAHGNPDRLAITRHGNNGGTAWSKTINGGISNYSHCVDRYDNIYIACAFGGTINVNPNGQYNLGSTAQAPLFILKLNSSGNFVWARKLDLNVNYSFSSPSGNCYRNIAVDSTGNVYLAGSFSGSAYFNPIGGGGYLNASPRSGFILSLDSSGNYNWVKQVGQNSNSVIHSLTLDRFGNLYTTGFFSGSVDFDPGWGLYNLASMGAADVFVHKLGRRQLVVSTNELTAGNSLLHVFPNPAGAQVHVQAVAGRATAHCRLLNINGALLKEISANSNEVLTIDLSEQAKGVYMIELISDKEISRTKLIKE